MNKRQKEDIQRFRKEGLSYSKISTMLSLPENTIKSFCRRNNMGGVAFAETVLAVGGQCRQCGTELSQIKGKKQKRFCSDKCRLSWWNTHPESINRKAVQIFTCLTCGQKAMGYGKRERKYCSRSCYGKSKAVKS